MKNNRLADWSVHEHVGFVDFAIENLDSDDTERLFEQMGDICAHFAASEQVRVVVVNADGQPLAHPVAAEPRPDACDPNSLWQPPSICATLAAIAQPVLIGISGEAVGLGLEMALACDLRVATENSQFALPQIGQGLMPADGGTQRLARLVGRGQALSMILTGDRIDAREALRIGLVSRVVPSGELKPHLSQLAARMAAKGPVALRYAKEAILAGMDVSLEQGLRLEADLYMLLHTTSDRTEGIKAFQAKRPALFEGR